MKREEYFAAPGLSHSALASLAVSPLHFWHRYINPQREPEVDTPEQILGTALHCAVLEPELFPARYYQDVDLAAHPGCLVTIEDLRSWMKDKGHSPKGTRKADIIAQAQAVDAHVPILEVLEREHDERNQGKIRLSVDDWNRVAGMAVSLRREWQLKNLLEQGEAETVLFATDPDTGILLKCMRDWVSPGLILDLKTFSQKRQKPIDRTIGDAIVFEHYYRQAYFYHYVGSLQPKPERLEQFVFAFVESSEPYSVRLRSLEPGQRGSETAYWGTARIEVRDLLWQYKECIERFGNDPWREPQEIEPLQDSDLRALAFA